MNDAINLKIKGENNEVQHRDCDFSNVTLDIIGNDNIVALGKGARLSDVAITIRGSGHRVHIGRACEIESLSLRMVHGSGLFAIGEGSFVQELEATVSEGTHMAFGRDCLVSKGAVAMTGDAHSIMDLENGRRINPSANIMVDDHVWLCRDVMLLKGARIGRDCIIEARALVTGDIGAKCLAAGTPARALRSGVTWDRELLPVVELGGADSADWTNLESGLNSCSVVPTTDEQQTQDDEQGDPMSDIATDHKCPHCGELLQPWEGPPETGWGLILVCCNNSCPHFSHSNDDVTEFNPESKLGFRYAEDPLNDYKSFNLASYCGDTFMEMCRKEC